MKKRDYELQVCILAHPDAEPKPLQQYGHEGRTFVEGRPGTQFCVVFRNHSSRKLLVVPSIDGLSCMDGEAATDKSSGYVVTPYRRVVIKGWRTSLKDSSGFVFEKRDEGYAVKTGNGAHCGVIGVRVYLEKNEARGNWTEQLLELRRLIKEQRGSAPVYPTIPYPVPVPYYPPRPYGHPWDHTTIWCSSNTGDAANLTRSLTGTFSTSELKVEGSSIMGFGQASFTANSSEVVDDAKDSVEMTAFALATGWGEQQKDEVDEVTFDRGELDAEFAIYYSDRSSLKDMGVELNPKPAVPKFPEPFRKFCQPPR